MRRFAPMPDGYTFVPKGDVYITRNCRKQTHEANKPLYIVLDKKGKPLGLRCPAHVHEAVLRQHHETAPKRAVAVQKRDTAIQEQFKKTLLKLYPRIPHNLVRGVVKHALEKHSGRVGRTETIIMERKVLLAVHAHIRHSNTEYDKLLKGGMSKEEARKKIWPKIIKVAKQWGGRYRVSSSKAKVAKHPQRAPQGKKVGHSQANNTKATTPTLPRPAARTAQKIAQTPNPPRFIPMRTKKSEKTAALVRPLPPRVERQIAPSRALKAQPVQGRISKEKESLKPGHTAMRVSTSPLRTRRGTASQSAHEQNGPANALSEHSSSNEVIVICSDDDDDDDDGDDGFIEDDDDSDEDRGEAYDYYNDEYDFIVDSDDAEAMADNESESSSTDGGGGSGSARWSERRR